VAQWYFLDISGREQQYFWNSGEGEEKCHNGTFGTQEKRMGSGTVVLSELRGSV
jgi:hypothetical protein